MKPDITQIIFDLRIDSTVFREVRSEDFRETMFNLEHAKLLDNAANMLEEYHNKDVLIKINEYRIINGLEPLEK